VVDGRFFCNESLRKNAMLELRGVWARVCHNKIVINTVRTGSITESKMKVRVNPTLNISSKEWE
jgi:hypothetical protein